MFARQSMTATKDTKSFRRKEFGTNWGFISANGEAIRIHFLDVCNEMMAWQNQRLACNCPRNE